MKPTSKTRLLRFESLEHRVVFAGNAIAMDGVVHADSALHGSMIGEGELHASNGTNHHVNGSTANHTSTTRVDKNASSSLGGIGLSTMSSQAIIAPLEPKPERLLPRNDTLQPLGRNASMGMNDGSAQDDAIALRVLPNGDPFRNAMGTVSNPSLDAWAIERPLAFSMDSSDIQRSINPFAGSQPPALAVSDAAATYAMEFDSAEFFAAALTEARVSEQDLQGEPLPWLALFGVVRTISPFANEIEQEDFANVRSSVLQVVATSEKSELQTEESRINSSSNGWKATSSILAAAFAAVVYRQRKYHEFEVASISAIKKRLRSSPRDGG